MSDNIYVEFLRFADDKGLQGFSTQEAIDRFGVNIEQVILSARKSGALVYSTKVP
jgi:hypothetical protein